MPNKPKTRTSLTKSMGNNSLIATLMTVCMLVVVASFVSSKQLLGDVRFNNRVIKAKDEANKILEANVEALPELETNFRNLEEDGPEPKDVIEALPNDEAYADLSAEFEALGGQSGVQLQSIALDSAVDAAAGVATPPTAPQLGPPLPQEVTFRVSVTGGFANLIQVLRNLEAAKRPMRVVTANLSGNEPQVKLEMQLVTFYQVRTELNDQTKEVR
jgi:hypothetical protein